MSNRRGAGRLLIVATLLFCAGAWSEPRPVAGEAPAPRIVLIIDDLGDTQRSAERIVALDAPVACAILPQTPYAKFVAESAHAAGKEVMLHLPLQPVAQYAALSVGTVGIDTTRAQLRRIVDINLANVPHAVGVSNHQGSLLTQHPGHMQWLMADLHWRGDLFFVDSYTSESSVALRFAREFGVPSVRRDVFLDHVPTWDAIDAQFRRLKSKARSSGLAIGIGHPLDVTINYLETAIPLLRAEGFRIVPVSEAIAHRRTLMVRAVDPLESEDAR